MTELNEANEEQLEEQLTCFLNAMLVIGWVTTRDASCSVYGVEIRGILVRDLSSLGMQ